MAAVTAAMVSQVQAGDHVVAARGLFGSCRWVVEDLLPRFGAGCTLVDGTDLNAWREAVRPETKAFLLETPSNPSLQIIDIAGVAAIAHEAGATLTVDNVFATPLFQKPLALGADCVVYSATKHIDGQGRCLGGVILASTEFIETKVQQFLRMTGPSISPFNAWVLLKGLETLALRVERQTANAGFLADALHDHPKLQNLIYPGRADHPQADLIRKQMTGASTMIALEVRGGKAGAFRFMNALKLIRISNNLGDAKSLVTHPSTTTHQRFTSGLREEMGISDGLVRLSVGLEHQNDLLADITAALEHV
jgi:O-succinylhomoserine sulfhydrylase